MGEDLFFAEQRLYVLALLAFVVLYGLEQAPADASLLGSADIRSLADLANAFSVVRHRRGVPFGLAEALSFAVAAGAPALPLVLIAHPIEDLVAQAVKLLLGM